MNSRVRRSSHRVLVFLNSEKTFDIFIPPHYKTNCWYRLEFRPGHAGNPEASGVTAVVRVGMSRRMKKEEVPLTLTHDRLRSAVPKVSPAHRALAIQCVLYRTLPLGYGILLTAACHDLGHHFGETHSWVVRS